MSELKNEASYCVGLSIGQSLLSQNLNEIDINSFLNGIQDIFFGGELKYTPEQANQIIHEFLNEVNFAKFAINKEEGDKFLLENAKKDSVHTLASGLQYEIIEKGEGAKPLETSQVTVHYHGTLLDGSIFDSSMERGTPATFGLNQVIKGWTEGLQLMSPGAKYRFYIPEHLAYGANPHPEGPIKPFMTLIFDVELITIN